MDELGEAISPQVINLDRKSGFVHSTENQNLKIENEKV
jgi:hypothetical protein